VSGAGGSVVPRGGNSEQEVESLVGGALTPTKTSSSSPPPPTKVNASDEGVPTTYVTVTPSPIHGCTAGYCTSDPCHSE